MAVAFDAITNVAAGTGDLSWTHTPVGTPRAIVVFIVQDGAGADRVNTVTYGTETMTEMTGSPRQKTTGEQSAIYGYFLGASIPTGNQTVTVDVTGVGSKRAVAISLTAAADTELQDVDATISSDSLENPSVTLGLGGKTCFCALALHSGIPDPANITPLTNWTAQLEHDYGAANAGFYTYDIVGTTDVTAGWTQTADDAQMIAVAVTESAATATYSGRGIGRGIGRGVMR